MQVWLSFLVAACAAAEAHAAELQGPDKVEPEVRAVFEQAPDGRFHVVALLSLEGARRESPESRAQTIATVQEEVLALLAASAFELRYRYATIPALTGVCDRAGLELLAASPAVASVGADGMGAHAALPLDDSVPHVRADDAHAIGVTGEGITVAVIDSGIDTDHPDLSDDLAAGAWHFLDQGLDQGPGAEDDNGHGTNVAGIVTSRGVVASVGVAPDADVLAIKVLGASGSGWLSDWAAGVDHVVANRDDYDDLRAINMSLGSFALHGSCPCDGASTIDMVLQEAILAARDAGIPTFASSGNVGGCGSMPSPACLSAAVAVAAAYDQDLGREPNSGTYQSNFGSGFADCFDAATDGDLVTCFSCRLPGCNDLAAPGRLIAAPGLGGGTSFYTGTSQAAPHCAGTAALIAEWTSSHCTRLTPDETIELMKDSARPVDDPCGAPSPVRIDVWEALQASRPPGEVYCAGDGSGTSCPCSNEGLPCRGCGNGSSAEGAALVGTGTASVAAGDLALRVTDGVPGQPGLFFQGNAAIQGGDGAHFGDGLRCAGQGVVRLEVVLADPSGGAQSSVPIAAAGGVSAGDVRRYQWWFRDPGGSPCGMNFNLSNGFEVDWVP